MCFGARSGINFSAAGLPENQYRRSTSPTLPECSRLVAGSSSGDPIATSVRPMGVDQKLVSIRNEQIAFWSQIIGVIVQRTKPFLKKHAQTTVETLHLANGPSTKLPQGLSNSSRTSLAGRAILAICVDYFCMLG